MANWHHVKNLATGDEQFVASLKGYPTDQWERTPLTREPGEFDEFIGGKLVENVERKVKSAKDARAAPISKADMLVRIEALEARVFVLEKPGGAVGADAVP